MADKGLVLVYELDGKFEHLLEVIGGVSNLGRHVAHPVNAVDDAVDVPAGRSERGTVSGRRRELGRTLGSRLQGLCRQTAGWYHRRSCGRCQSLSSWLSHGQCGDSRWARGGSA